MRTFLAWALLGSVAACVDTSLDTDPDVVVREATVELVPPRCAGVVVGDGTHALTSAHCVEEGEARFEFELFDGRHLKGSLVELDRHQDLALVRLDRRAPVRPLAVAGAVPVPGAPLMFAGSNEFMHTLQRVSLERIGRCPSLPFADGVLFTTLRGQPGDSGAPVVDSELRVVGLVHGGALCHIAAPVAPFAALVPGARG